jgi:hypothetical protein
MRKKSVVPQKSFQKFFFFQFSAKKLTCAFSSAAGNPLETDNNSSREILVKSRVARLHVDFQTKNPNLYKFCKDVECKRFIYLYYANLEYMYYSYWVHFMAIW